MIKWEYTTFSVNIGADEDRIERELAKFGNQGWELVAAVDAPSQTVRWHRLYFKRRVGQTMTPADNQR